MKRILLFTLTLLLALAFIMPNRVHAAAKPSPTPVKHFHTVIGSVSADSITVQEPKATKTYKIDKYTRITYEGKTSTAADLKTGMRVSVSASTDPTVAEVITASEPPKDHPVAPATKATPAKKKGS